MSQQARSEQEQRKRLFTHPLVVRPKDYGQEYKKVDHGRAKGRAEKRKFIGSGEDGHLYDHY